MSMDFMLDLNSIAANRRGELTPEQRQRTLSSKNSQAVTWSIAASKSNTTQINALQQRAQ
jgi:hypothetical protein